MLPLAHRARIRRIAASTLAAGTIVAALAVTMVPALALSVTVDGQATTFDPPPIERAGRVFVPLRGVFERLGASVVYASGTINATSRGRAISLHIGSTRATVDGAERLIDVAPFVIGASTYVPLRFVSEALGAGVNYDAANQIVALNTGGGARSQVAAPVAAPPPAAAIHILREVSRARAVWGGAPRPTISANFSAPVDPNSLRITLDGLDVSEQSTRSPSGFIFAPASPLQSMPHDVVVAGTLKSGEPFRDTWRFTTGSEVDRNSLTIVSPNDGDPVAGDFTITGRTLPNALVHVVAGAAANFAGQSFAFGAGNFAGDAVADAGGNFAIPVHVQGFPGATVGVTVTSTDPSTKESAQKKLRLRTQ